MLGRVFWNQSLSMSYDTVSLRVTSRWIRWVWALTCPLTLPQTKVFVKVIVGWYQIIPWPALPFLRLSVSFQLQLTVRAYFSSLMLYWMVQMVNLHQFDTLRKIVLISEMVLQNGWWGSTDRFCCNQERWGFCSNGDRGFHHSGSRKWLLPQSGCCSGLCCRMHESFQNSLCSLQR